jgi:hypothetical protein
MKQIDDITVTVTYRVCLRGVEVPDWLFKKLETLHERGSFSPDSIGGSEFSDAIDWISANTVEADAFDWECKIDSLEDNKYGVEI